MADCQDVLTRMYPEAKAADIKAMLAELERRRSDYFLSGDHPTREGFYQRGLDYLHERQYALYAAKKEALHNLLVHNTAMEVINQPAFKDDPWNALKAMMVGGEGRLSKGGNNSHDLMMRSLQERWGAETASQLDKLGLVGAAESGVMDEQVAASVQHHQVYGPSQTPISPTAAAIGKVIYGVNQDILKTLQLSGSKIRELMGYITRQSHDPDRIGAVEKPVWIQKVLNRLDTERTFPGLSQQEVVEKLSGDYDNITTGRWQRPEINLTPQKYFEVSGLSHDLSAKTGQSRSYVFKSPEDWVAYNREFGNKTLLQSVFSAIDQHARNAATMHFFGTNPDSMFKSLKDAIRENLSTDMQKRFDENVHSLNQAYATMRGMSDVPGTSTPAKLANFAMNVQSLAKLGPVVATKVPSDLINTILRENSAFGKNIFSTTANTLKNWAAEFTSPSEKTQALLSLKRISEQLSGAIIDSPDSRIGMMSKLKTMLWRYTGMERQTEAIKTVMAGIAQKNLAEVSHLPWAELPQAHQQELLRFGIDQHDWGVFQRAIEVGHDGTRLMTPEALHEVPDPIVENAFLKGKWKGDEKLYPEQLDKYKFGLEVKFMNLLRDQQNIASTTPGNRQKAFFLRGTTGDDGYSILLRMLAQFKQVPMQLFDETRRSMMTASGKTSALASMTTVGGNIALAQRIGALTAAGYVSVTLHNLMKGEEPPSPSDPHTLTKAFVHSGALGLWADGFAALSGATGGKDASKALLHLVGGPVLGQAADLPGVMSGNHKAEHAIEMVKQNAPFQNAPFVGAALNHFVFDSIKQAADPSYESRHQKYQRNKLFK